MSELTNYPIPVTIKGPLDKLEVKPDLTAGILEILENRQKKQTTAKPAQVTPAHPQEPKKPEDALKELLQDLLKKQ